MFGTGVTSGGKSSLYIREFVISKVHYRLTSASGGAMSGSSPAGGGASVAFDAGQVHEMWMSAAAGL